MKLRDLEEFVTRSIRERKSGGPGSDATERIMQMMGGAAPVGIDRIEEENKKAMDWLGRVNLIVTGRSGAGKSTLINTVFRKELAKVGVGLPVTQETRCYEDPELPLRVFDTKGLELGAEAQRQVLDEIRGYVEDGLAAKDPDRRIDAIWYCVNAGANRIEPMELEWIGELASLGGVGLIVVLTQCFREEAAKELKAVIEANVGRQAACVMVLAQDDPENRRKKAFGLRQLMNATMDRLGSEKKKLAFISAQGLDRKLKEEAARKCIPVFARNALLASAVSGAALAANEVVMCSRITSIYGLDLDRHFLKEILSVMLGVVVATAGGRAAAKAVTDAALGWIPGERLVTGVVNGATAASVTMAFGQTYVTLLTMIDRGEMTRADLSTERIRGKIKSIFSREYDRALRLRKKERKTEARPESAPEAGEKNESKPKRTLPNPLSLVRHFPKFGGGKDKAKKKTGADE